MLLDLGAALSSRSQQEAVELSCLSASGKERFGGLARF